MIDIHSHILPEIDDGAPDLNSALYMAKMAVKDGIQAMFATPHINSGTEMCLEEIKEKTQELQAVLVDQKVPLKIYGGAELSIGSGAYPWKKYGLHQGPYILVEFPHSHIPALARQHLYDLQCDGLIPIIAHPERNGAFLQKPDLLEELVATGCKVQITAQSVTGELGAQVQLCSHYMLRKKVVDFLATDSHSPEFRKPMLKKAHKVVARIIGKKAAYRLVFEHPEAVINGTSF